MASPLSFSRPSWKLAMLTPASPSVEPMKPIMPGTSVLAM
jgi:hypothetical protein